jgi:hypothetical protein
MKRSFSRCRVAAPLLTVALIWGCAQSGAGDPTPDLETQLPDVDASWKPKPTKSGSDQSSTSDQASSATSDDPTTPAVDGSEPDANGGTTSPPPPPPPTPPKPAEGEVLITEVMYDSTGVEPSTEWIEVYNTTSSARSLSGLSIVDGGNRKQVIGLGVEIAPGAYALLVRNKSAALTAKLPSSAILFEYGAGQTDSSGVQLANGSSGAVYLRDGSTTIAQADYGGWFTQNGGSSIQLKTLTFAASAQSANWCLSKTAWATGSDKGTPGAASDCP